MVSIFKAIEKIIQKDPGDRGINHFYTEALEGASACLQEAKHVAILTGLFIPEAMQPETDGPPGALFLAQSLASLGKKVTLITDSHCHKALQACYQVLKDHFPEMSVQLIVFPESHRDQEEFISSLCSEVDTLVSIERVGRNVEGSYHSMRGIDISEYTAPLDQLFLYAQEHPKLNIKTIGIGDGGNEIGMGSAIEKVHQFIPLGKQIGCVVPADYLIVTGISNWGAYALAGALYLRLNKSEKKTPFNHVYPEKDLQLEMLHKMIEVECCDGVLAKVTLSVDGFEWAVHEKVWADIGALISK